MLKVRIKAIKRAVHDDLIKKYENPILHACDILLGTEFISINGEMPEGFCASAWESVGPYAKRLASSFTIGSLYHLYKGGRLNYTAMVAGRLLRFKPVIETNSEGKLEKSGTYIGKNKAIGAMLEALEKTIDTSSRSIYIGYTNNIDEANSFRDKLKEKYSSMNIIVEPIDKTMGCHCGPESIAIFYFRK